MKNQKAFTLIELMIAVVIIGVLAAIGYPEYLEQVRKSRRNDAQAALLGLAAGMERFYTTNNTYVGAADANARPLSTVFSSTVPIQCNGCKVYYDLTISDVKAASYTVSATPRSGNPMDGDACGTFTLDNFGVRSVNHASRPVDACWR